MQCFQNELMRDWLFAWVSELDPSLPRDDLLLDEVLQDNGIDGPGALASLDHEDAAALARQIAAEMPLAA